MLWLLCSAVVLRRIKFKRFGRPERPYNSSVELVSKQLQSTLAGASRPLQQLQDRAQQRLE
jgi:hypothetical protein